MKSGGRKGSQCQQEKGHWPFATHSHSFLQRAATKYRLSRRVDLLFGFLWNTDAGTRCTSEEARDRTAYETCQLFAALKASSCCRRGSRSWASLWTICLLVHPTWSTALSYALSLWVSPQTRQIARKIFTDFCHVVSFGLEIPWTRICFNSA